MAEQLISDYYTIIVILCYHLHVSLNYINLLKSVNLHMLVLLLFINVIYIYGEKYTAALVVVFL